jgi:hypothetical protein
MDFNIIGIISMFYSNEIFGLEVEESSWESLSWQPKRKLRENPWPGRENLASLDGSQALSPCHTMPRPQVQRSMLSQHAW